VSVSACAGSGRSRYGEVHVLGILVLGSYSHSHKAIGTCKSTGIETHLVRVLAVSEELQAAGREPAVDVAVPLRGSVGRASASC
jgi:hypothetical protein